MALILTLQQNKTYNILLLTLTIKHYSFFRMNFEGSLQNVERTTQSK